MNTIDVEGLKCDAKDCDYVDENITLEEYEEYLNKPCPKCGANLLTQEDIAAVKVMIKMIDMLNEVGLTSDNPDDYKTYKADMDGTGKVDLNEVEK